MIAPDSMQVHDCCGEQQVAAAAERPAHETRLIVTGHPTPADMRRLALTWTGTAVTYPPGAIPLRSMVILPPGKRIASHLHPFPRIAEVLSGRLRVVQEAGPDVPERVRVFEPGDTIVETVGRYHFGESVGDEPARPIVFDFLPGDVVSNTVYRDAPREAEQ